jgi:hypothetical protein
LNRKSTPISESGLTELIRIKMMTKMADGSNIVHLEDEGKFMSNIDKFSCGVIIFDANPAVVGWKSVL